MGFYHKSQSLRGAAKEYMRTQLALTYAIASTFQPKHRFLQCRYNPLLAIGEIIDNSVEYTHNNDNKKIDLKIVVFIVFRAPRIDKQKMKRVLLVAAIGLTSIAFSQKGNTSSAGIAFKNYWSLKLSGGDAEEQAKELRDAKEFIDKSYVHEDTKDDPKTLMYYGKIYIEIPFCAAMSGDEELSAVDS